MATRRPNKLEIAEARESLLKILNPGDTVYCVLRHVSRSGMYRAIDLYALKSKDGKLVKFWLSRLAARAIGERFDKRHEAIGTSGCGMDMGFHLVSNLSDCLWPEGFGCTGERCPSNEHSNGDRDYTPHGNGMTPHRREVLIGRDHWHRPAGHLLRCEWI